MLTTEIAAGVYRLDLVFVNVYFIGEREHPWFLIDTGVSSSAEKIRSAARERFDQTMPSAILLTHGHADHSGSVKELAHFWNVPVYLHPAELPFLSGSSTYPPPDPTVGGFLAFLTRFIPINPLDLSGLSLLNYPPDGICPAGLPQWQWIHTPGHAPGQVSFYRERDGLLIAGDAFATMNLDSLVSVLRKSKVLSRPPASVTFDWDAAQRSVKRLAALRPSIVAAGHGQPMSGKDLPDQLQTFAETMRPPRRGRYVQHPARVDATGITYLPPKPLVAFGPPWLAVVLAGLLLLTLVGLLFRKDRRLLLG